ncbi:MAG: hypothetical protein L3J39_16180 [Verrucomicrobiales bacterium]|nr:hypothetical protein [Verrucomicrobiales bacterium]
MKTPEEHDPTWELLLKAKTQQPSSAFVRNVVREARQLDAPHSSSYLSVFFNWFKRPTIALPAAIAACAVLITTFSLLQLQPNSADQSSQTSTTSIAQAPTSSTMLEITSENMEQIDYIHYLGDLVTTADPGELDDQALAALFF